jgi:hypothetical protein
MARRDEIAAWLDENRSTPKVHEAFGVEWPIPAQMPGRLWFWYRAAFEAKGRTVRDATFDELDEVVDMCGLHELVDEAADAGAGRDAIYTEVLRILVGYLFPEAGGASGEAKPRSTSGRSSASTSGSSRRTSSASTKSTSAKRSKRA